MILNKKKLSEDIVKFLKEYQELCQKHKMGLQGCGCCGSPYLDNNSEDIQEEVNDINYDYEDNCIKIDYLTLNEFLEKNKEMEEN